MLTFDDYNFAPTPNETEAIYASGFRGVLRDSFGRQAAQNLPTFYQSFPMAKGHGKGRLSAPYRCAVALDSEYSTCEAQTTGDCVSHSTRNAGMIDYCVDAYFGETTYEGRLATEPIYGYRGHGGQGASCDRLANYVSQQGPGGFLVRKDYGVVDLSVYNSRIGHNWGRPGTPDAVNELAAENKALQVMRCESLEEARDAIAMGFGISRCGWWGYDQTRNNDGVSGTKGRWSHAMAWVGFDETPAVTDKYPGGLLCMVQSWGKYFRGPKHADQPESTAWIEAKNAKAEIDRGGCYVIASVRGFDRELVYDTAAKVREISDS